MRIHAKELKILSDLLGDDHDLSIFRQTLRELPGEMLTTSDCRSLLAPVQWK